MKVPKVFSTNNHEYILIKEYKKFALYKDLMYGYNECFDYVSLIPFANKKKRTDIHPENRYIKLRNKEVRKCSTRNSIIRSAGSVKRYC